MIWGSQDDTRVDMEKVMYGVEYLINHPVDIITIDRIQINEIM